MKPFLKYTVIFILLVLICTFSLVAVAMIPNHQIHMEESVDQLTSRSDYYIHIIDGVDCSIWDDIADSNSLNVAYFWNSEHPLESVMWSGMYYEDEMLKKESLKKAVYDHMEPNTQYLRYWHGYLLFVKPLLLIFNLKQIYMLHYLIMTALLLGLSLLLLHHGLRLECCALAVSLVAVSIWFVPMCLEYTWMFLLMLIVSTITVQLALRKRYESFPLLFFITGIITVFLDFFTTETLTVLVPLLLAVRIRIRQNEEGNWKMVIKCCATWCIGYILMWVAKWGITAMVLGIDVTPYIKDKMAWHFSVTSGMTKGQYFWEAISRNVGCLFPIGYGVGGVAAFFLMAIMSFLAVYFDKIRARQEICWDRVGIFAFLGVIPYVRYLIIHHHVWYHYFFTYRAQAATVMAMYFIVAELVEINRPAKYTQPISVSRR